jgi:queuine tRNA-ribosyltransferase
MPTRNARNGQLFTWQGTMNMRNKKWENDFSPLDPEGESYVDSFYTKAYVRHLFAAEELLAMQIATVHNLNFYLRLVRKAREKIIEGTFAQWKNEMVPILSQRL